MQIIENNSRKNGETIAEVNMITDTQIFCGDCLEVMNNIPDSSVDMILTDLPYGTTMNKWDKKIPLKPLWKQYKRIAKQNAAIILFSQMPFTVDLINSNRKMFRYEWIWQKAEGTNFLNARRMPMKIHENILVFYQKLPKYNPIMEQGKPYHKGNCDKTSTKL